MSGSLLNKQSTKLIPTSNRSRHGSEHGKELEYYIFFSNGGNRLYDHALSIITQKNMGAYRYDKRSKFHVLAANEPVTIC